ncbi:MAG: TRAP transporter small permease [Planctomycetota bacterium]|jgi:TRAP-type C4-dicarboxylate transport system permease small subunit|nr:TRAP transporter small permease [Planctomycetota bacterium]
MKRTADRFINILEKVAVSLVTLCIIGLMVALVWQVLSRFVINVPAVWTEEIGRYSFINMVLLGSAVGVRKNSHFGVTFFSDMLRGRMRDYYMRYFVNVLILICAAVMLYYGTIFAFRFGLNRVSPTFLTPMVYAFVILPVSAAFMLCFALYNIVFGDYSQQLDSVQEVLKEHESAVE